MSEKSWSVHMNDIPSLPVIANTISRGLYCTISPLGTKMESAKSVYMQDLSQTMEGTLGMSSKQKK